MSVGIAFSGGGIPAAIGVACAWNAIADVYPSLASSTNLTISTVSGGSIGYGLWTNANHRINFPTYRRNVTLEELLERHFPESTVSNVSRHGNPMSDPEETDGQWCRAEKIVRKISVGQFADRLRGLPFVHLLSRSRKWSEGAHHSHWWTSMIERIFHVVCIDDILGGEVPWISSFAFLDEALPLPKRAGKGTLLPQSSATGIHHALTDLSTGRSIMLHNGKKYHTREPTPSMDVLSYTSAFWAAPLVTSQTIPYSLFSKMLLRANRSAFDGLPGSAVVLDGGVVDTMGLIGLLLQQTEHIVAFYNNNIPLSKIASPIAYLFGINTTTDSMNSLLGPKTSQVFKPELYENVIINLTNPGIGMAQLTEVEVLPNQMGVEPYVIETLTIFSNARNDNFVLEDRIMGRLASSWPDGYAFSPPRLDANALCMFNDWKVRSNGNALDPIFGL